MTSLDKLLDEIMSMARNEADGILASAKDEAAKIESGNKKKIERETKEILEKAHEAAGFVLERGTSDAKIQERGEILALKQELIRNTVEKAKKAVTELGDKEYFDLLSGWAGAIDIAGKAVVCLNRRDLARGKTGFLNSFPSALKAELSSEPAEISGGFLALCGGITVNCSIDAMFESHANQINNEVKLILLGRE